MRKTMNHEGTKTPKLNHNGTTTQRTLMRVSRAKRALIPLRCAVVPLWLIFLSGCAGEPPPRLLTQIQIERPEIPPELLTCPAIPLPPQGIAMQSDAAAYMIDLFGAGSECRRRLEAVGGLVGGAAPVRP